MATKKSNDVVGKSATRAAKTRAIRQEALRQELKSREYIRQLHAILDSRWITAVTDEDGNPVYDERGQPVLVNMAQEKRGKADIYLRLLAKTLPDLKAVEHRVEDEESMDEWVRKNAEVVQIRPA